jgi:alanine racemase
VAVTRRLTLQQIADATNGTIVGGEPDDVFDHVVTDSRTTIAEHGVFVALRGRNFDAHDFLDEANRRGADAAVVEHARIDDAKSFAAVVAVDDTLDALQNLAVARRARFAGQVVGITGSNGKTIVKEMLASIVGRDRTTYRSPGSYNSQVGVPLSVLGIGSEHEVAIIEAGISEIGEMANLEPIVRPDIGVITNVGDAHRAGLGDLETTAREKLELFRRLDGPLIYNADDDVLREHVDAEQGYGFGESEDADYRLLDVVAAASGFTFTVRFPDDRAHDFAIGVPGLHNVWNAAAAIAAADRLDISVQGMQAALGAFELSPMRMQMHTTRSGVTLLNDAYSSDPVSAAAALNALVHYAAGQRTIAILGDMLDLGVTAHEAHAELGALVARLGIDHLICVGPLAREIGRAAVADGMALSHVWETPADREGLDEILGRLVEPGDYVLFKGSRALGLERAAQSLLESVAPARLYVDLDAIRENVQAIRNRIGHETGVMAVVKSFGYGNDSNRVALTLLHAGVDAFAVAYPDEGIPLRRRGIDVPILVTNVRASEADKIAKYRLTPLIFTEEALAALAREARRRNTTLEVHVEVDTGMNRLGLKPEHAVEFCRRVAETDAVRLQGIMTHFAAADAPAEDPFTHGQIAAFDEVLAALDDEGLRPPVVHAANTAAAWRFPEARYDMVRVGLGLYGVHPSPDVGAATNGVRPALRFVTEVLWVKTVEDGETVSYGRTWKADGPREIATIAVGYNDGFSRFMSNGGEVLIRGRRCPVVGNVCMDASMVDVTDLDEVAVGDEVVLFGEQRGEQITVEELAAQGRTINYEILTNVSPRVRRIFTR